MTRTAARTAALAGTPDEMEAAFYDALQAGDVVRLMACWADEDEIVCVQPGGARLLGHAAIRAAFTELFARGGLAVQPTQVARVHSLTSAVHSVREQIRMQLPDGPHEAAVHATNVYLKTAQGWRLVAHHASSATLDAPATDASVARILH